MIIPSSARGLRDLSRLIKKSSYRRERGLFVAEGEKIFFELPAKDILQVFFSRTYFSSHQNRLIPRLFRLPYDVLEDSVFEKISDTVTPQGVLSVISYPSYRPEDLVEAAKKSGGILLVLEAI